MSLRRSLFCLIVFGSTAVGAEPEAFDVNHLVTLKRVSEPAVSASGTHLVYTQREVMLDRNASSRDLWLLDLSDRKAVPQRLTSHSANDTSAVWHPDNEHVLFLSSRSGRSQVWQIGINGGEASPVTDLPVDVAAFALSPDGTRLAMAMNVFPDCESLQCTVDRLNTQSEQAASGRVHDALFVRHWDHWKDGRRSQIFVQTLDTQHRASGDVQRLTPESTQDTPVQPFGGAEDFIFTADGQSIILTARTADRDEAWSTNMDLYQVPVSAESDIINQTRDNLAWDTSPIVTEDGRQMAWLAMSRPGYESDRYRIMLKDLATGQTREVAPEWDRSPGSIAFARGGRTIIAGANDLGNRRLFAIDTRSGKVTALTGPGHAGAFSVAGQNLVYALDTLDRPADFHAIGLDGRNPRQLTAVNAEALSGMSFGQFEQFSFTGWNDETVYGYVMKPVDYQFGQKYPVAFLIHGGPQGSFGNHFHYRWNPQTYAGAGYASVFIDFHGSTGYGQAFTDSIAGDWGGKPLEDLQLGLAHALEQYEFLDDDRMCALGASYGGYMINWIAGNWPDRFDCLVNHDGIFDNRMMYYATEELWFPEWEHGGTYHDHPEAYERHNPVNHVSQWQTPMLVIQGALDFRVPETQALATFTALQRRNIPSRLLYYPDENHWVLKPASSIQWHEEVTRWLNQWTAP